MVTMTLRIKAANRRMAAGMQKRRAMAGVGGCKSEVFWVPNKGFYRSIFVYDAPTAHAPIFLQFRVDSGCHK